MKPGRGDAWVWKTLGWTAGVTLVLLGVAFLMNRSKTPVPPAEPDRVAEARRRCEAALRAEFEKEGVRWPAGEIFLRGMKRERQLELWARNAAGESFRLVKRLPITAASGRPGPKRREGDMQVPEGFYEVERFNPLSAFRVSLGLNYPNASDRVLSDAVSPGFDIFIHGGNASIGCIALGDSGIEEVYLAALDSRARPIHVHLFPARMDSPDWPAWREAQCQKRPELRSFWEQLASGWKVFERTRQLPHVRVEADGAYHCEPGAAPG